MLNQLGPETELRKVILFQAVIHFRFCSMPLRTGKVALHAPQYFGGQAVCSIIGTEGLHPANSGARLNHPLRIRFLHNHATSCGQHSTKTPSSPRPGLQFRNPIAGWYGLP